jgi:hypothetical protein
MSDLKIMLVPRSNSPERIKYYQEQMKDESLQELAKRYNASLECGIVGSLEQGIMLLVLRSAFIKLTGQSPIVLEGGAVLSLTSAVELRDGTLYYLDGREVGNGKMD